MCSTPGRVRSTWLVSRKSLRTRAAVPPKYPPGWLTRWPCGAAPALADVPSDLLQAERARLKELRLLALERRVDADLALGRHLELLPELQALVRDQPLREALRGQLMVALYRSGRQADALALYQEGRRVLAEDLGIDPGPDLRALELAILNQEPRLASPSERGVVADRQTQRGPNLPQYLSSFVGREAEMATLSQLVATHRVTTVVGAAGGGKTRLALKVAAGLSDGTFEGVSLAELASLRDPALVANQVAEAIGVPEQSGRPIVGTLVDAVGTNHFLIILDNCEHLVNASADLVETLLQRCPGVHVLATSREPLGVEGEHLYRLVPLSTPLTESGILVEEVGKFDAVQLFVERAADQRADFTLDDTNAGAVAAVCQHLDGIPLAIELAAARLRSMSVFDLESNLADRFRLLTGGRRTALPRHRSLKAMIDWSYEMLLPAEQTVLSRLSPFAGGWRLDAAQRVCAGEGVDPAEVAAVVCGLVDKSLVEVELAGRATRYRLPETIRQYAADRLVESGEADSAARSHAEAYLEVAELAAPQLRGHEQAKWLARIDEDLDNIRVASATLLAARDAKEQALRLAAAQGWYCDRRARYREGVDLAEAALQKAGELRTIQWVKVLQSLFWIKAQTGDLQPEQGRVDEGLAIARAYDDAAIVSDLLIIKVVSSYNRGQVGPDVVATANECIELARGTGDPHVIGRALVVSPVAFEGQGTAVVRSSLEEAVCLFRAAGDQHWLSSSLNNLACAEMMAEDFTQAGVHLEEAITITAGLIGESSTLAGLFLNSGTAAVMQGDRSAAEALFREAFNIADKVGSRDAEAVSILGLACSASAASQWHRAASLHGLAQGLEDQLGQQWQPLEGQMAADDRRKLREQIGGEGYEEAFGSGHRLAKNWWQTDRLSRAACIFVPP